jgi:hypothetical protein
MIIPKYMRSRYRVLLVIGLGGLFSVVRLAIGQDWTPTSAPALPWKAVAASADFTRLVATGYDSFFIEFPGYTRLPIYVSTDSGTTWTQTTAPYGVWTSVASSVDGKKLVAVSRSSLGSHSQNTAGVILTSDDFGTNWTLTSAVSNVWTSVACSADGVKLVAVSSSEDVWGRQGDGLIHTSTNSGATWTVTSAPSRYWGAVASSTDGTKLVAACGDIYTSTNSGANWTLTSAPSSSWTSVASSADGIKLVAGGYNNGGLIYVSTNSGVTWRATSPWPDGWTSVASSADGTTLVAVAGDADFGVSVTSMNSGATWTEIGNGGANWSTVATAADGNKLIAVGYEYPGAISARLWIWPYLPASPPPPLRFPHLTIGLSGADLRLSWLVPSTRFTLQQNSDLTRTNWTDVPTPPTLNFTNLNYESSVPPTPGQNFYRLKQQ